MNNGKSKNRHKYLLQYHLIFVCKYRKKVLVNKEVDADIKLLSYEICNKHGIVIKYMETDKDHIHYLIETEPTQSISGIVDMMKSYTTYHIGQKHENKLKYYIGGKHEFGTDGYFVCSVGNVSEQILKEYIENQG